MAVTNSIAVLSGFLWFSTLLRQMPRIYIQKGMTAFSDFYILIVTSSAVVWLKQCEEIA
jgi:hypothetical protein